MIRYFFAPSETQSKQVEAQFPIFYIAHQLGLDDEVVANWSIEKLTNWMLYFKLLHEKEQGIIGKAIGKPASNHTSTRSVSEHSIIFK